MKRNHFLLFFSCLHLWAFSVRGQQNAAPSIHLTYFFPSNDALLKMQKIKIVQSAFATYFEVNQFTNGYAGLQQTPDNTFGNPNILISSLWDVNTATGIYSNVDYKATTTFKSRFGGEGNGWKTIHPFNWQLNTWYNIVNRSWKSGGRLYIGTFIQDITTGKWFHTATLSIPAPNQYLRATNDAFLENWDGSNPTRNGSFVRKAFFKDCWNINTNGTWEKNTRANFSANDSQADITRNGIYHNSFDANFDANENAYYMQHGGTTTRSALFNGGRTLALPAQANQGTTPVLTLPVISTFTATTSAGKTTFSWTIDETKSPQLSAKLELLDGNNNVIQTVEDTLPHKRSIEVNNLPINRNYTAGLVVRDIFNQLSQVKNVSFVITHISTAEENESVKISPNPAHHRIDIEGKNIKTIRIIDELGRVLWNQSAAAALTTLNVASFPKGIYFVHLEFDNHLTQTKKIVIR